MCGVGEKDVSVRVCECVGWCGCECVPLRWGLH